MAMNAYGVVKGIDVFKHQQVRLLIILNLEAIELFPFNQGVEGFDAGIVPWIAFLRIAAAHLCGFLDIGLRKILTTAVRVNYYRTAWIPGLLCHLNHPNNARCIQLPG